MLSRLVFDTFTSPAFPDANDGPAVRPSSDTMPLTSSAIPIFFLTGAPFRPLPLAKEVGRWRRPDVEDLLRNFRMRSRAAGERAGAYADGTDGPRPSAPTGPARAGAPSGPQAFVEQLGDGPRAVGGVGDDGVRRPLCGIV